MVSLWFMVIFEDIRFGDKFKGGRSFRFYLAFEFSYGIGFFFVYIGLVFGYF